MASIWGPIWADIWGGIWGDAAAPAPTPEPTAPPVLIVQSSGGGNTMGIRLMPFFKPQDFKPEMHPPKRPIEEDEALLLAVL